MPKKSQNKIKEADKFTEEKKWQPSEAAKNFDIYDIVFPLLMDEPFFAALSRNIVKTATFHIPTAGVTINKNFHFELLYNPEFFVNLTDKEQKAILKHEFYHIILEHITSRKPKEKKMAKYWNFATDLAINSFLKDELPEGCLVPGGMGFEKYPLGKSSEWYFNELQQDPDFDIDSCDGQFDDHDMWQDLKDMDYETARDIVRHRLKKILRDSVNEANQKSWGSIPENMRKDIIIASESFVNWRAVLRFFVYATQRCDKSSSIKRVNKRYPYKFPGKKINRVANVAISIDQSGSVSDDMLAAFFAELNSLAEIATFTVIPFDTEVAEECIFEWKKGKKYSHKRVKCGGTDFNAPTDYVNEHKNWDGHIVLTDMQAPKPRPSRCKRIWMTTPDCVKNPYFNTNEVVVAITK